MKHCPQCRQTYTDETLKFCRVDGTLLPVDGESSNTLILPVIQTSDASSTMLLQSEPAQAKETVSLIGASRDPQTRKLKAAAGSKRYRRGLTLAMSALLLAAAGFAFWFSKSRSSSARPNLAPIESIAVLPFENASGNADLEYLSDGLSESLIDKLSQLQQLKVIARNSSFKYRGADVDLQDAANKLGVRAIVTGKVARFGENLTVRVEMIDAEENRQLWSEQYNRKTSDLLSIQQEIAQIASEKLRLKLSGEQQQQLAKRETLSPAAFELMLKGRFSFNQSGSDQIKKAVEYMEQAVAADPNYALAFAELSMKYTALAARSLGDPKIYIPKAESAARKALELDENLAEAQLAISQVYGSRWQWQEAEAAGKRAIQLDPNNAAAHDAYGGLLSFLGRHDEAIAEARRARELDPLSPLAGRNLGYRLYLARRYDESIAELKKILEKEPNLDYVYVVLGYSYAGKRQFKEAIRAYQEALRLGNKGSSTQIYLGAAYALAGETGKARDILKHLQSGQEYVAPGELPILYAALGEKEASFASLEKAYNEHDLQLQWIKSDPAYDPLRNDPRFQELLRKVGFPP